MALWLPAARVVLPYLTQIVAAAIPAFTHKPERSESDDLTRRQIAELQDAVTRNAEAIKTVAVQLERVVQDLDAASARIEKATRTAQWLALAALLLAAMAMGLALYAWAH